MVRACGSRTGTRIDNLAWDLVNTVWRCVVGPSFLLGRVLWMFRRVWDMLVGKTNYSYVIYYYPSYFTLSKPSREIAKESASAQLIQAYILQYVGHLVALHQPEFASGALAKAEILIGRRRLNVN
ncbi:hypothetical protein BDQ17DRAFT_1328928 [Cyathus striatus]|nr:hypothetical protein BDQ17DRAFT_1328928 [Cyathus striatus]